MDTVYIGVGSNIEPEANIIEALRMLRRVVAVTGVSTFYRTEPIDRPEQASFYNGVFRIETGIAPHRLKEAILRPAESSLGRERTADKYAARTIDLDILVYGDTVDGAEIPDPDIYARPFLAAPLLELAPNLVLPDSGRSIREVVDSLRTYDMTPLPEFTNRLRMEIADEP